MSEHSDPVTWSWIDVAKGVGGVILTVVMRLVFGRAMSGIERKLGALSELNAIRAELSACRSDIATLKNDVEVLKRPVHAEPPR